MKRFRRHLLPGNCSHRPTLRADLARRPREDHAGSCNLGRRFSANTATWLFIRDPAQLTAEKQGDLELICQHSETACKTYTLTQQFMTMLRLRRGQEFETWLEAVEASQIAELRRFAHS